MHHGSDRSQFSRSSKAIKRLILCLIVAIAVTPLLSSPPLASPATSKSPLHNFVICIDPGHPSETSAGTASRDGKLTENHVNWVVGKRLEALLRGDGATVVVTKSTEHERVTNERRAEIANAAHTDLMIRIHCDSGPTSGFATFYPARTGKVHGVTGPPAIILKESRQVAYLFHKAAIKCLDGKLSNRGVHDESGTRIGAKQGALTGSIYARIPVITVEMCVLSSEHDYEFARSNMGQEELAHALKTGAEACFARKRSGTE
jgi:N-acetylmuramoyl-L-alanine amidase